MEQNSKKRGFPSVPRFLLKLFILVVLVLVLAAEIVSTLREKNVISRDERNYEDRYSISYYEEKYFRKQYASLYFSLTIYDYPKDDELYGRYWEVVEAYIHLLNYKDYHSAATRGLIEAEPKAVEERKLLQRALENVKFEENEPKIREMLESIEN